MRIVLQRVAKASVVVGEEVVGGIGPGLLLLVGVAAEDGEAQVEEAARKIAGLRIFEDAGGKMNLDLVQAGGALLVVSQFTLLASTDRGRRPSFERAAPPAAAEPLIGRFVGRLRAAGVQVETGRFGAHMRVALVNDGPVTLVLDFPAAR
jgi:D-aminoacyl-tRNA deacylase